MGGCTGFGFCWMLRLVCYSREEYVGEWGLLMLIFICIGTITEYSVYGSPASQVSEDQLESDEVWRFYPTMPIGDFFEKWIEKMQGGGSSR